ncbi:hypothetical protein [Facilibium subflavum]|uniref:hypothetical protein n=1 Tax=Facilibium subflavum TaxID=2219058 RepID=UPI000E6501A7|nr:hypothetical protein [Facilibium subflavum]
MSVLRHSQTPQKKQRYHWRKALFYSFLCILTGFIETALAKQKPLTVEVIPTTGLLQTRIPIQPYPVFSLISNGAEFSFLAGSYIYMPSNDPGGYNFISLGGTKTPFQIDDKYNVTFTNLPQDDESQSLSFYLDDPQFLEQHTALQIDKDKLTLFSTRYKIKYTAGITPLTPKGIYSFYFDDYAYPTGQPLVSDTMDNTGNQYNLIAIEHHQTHNITLLKHHYEDQDGMGIGQIYALGNNGFLYALKYDPSTGGPIIIGGVDEDLNFIGKRYIISTQGDQKYKLNTPVSFIRKEKTGFDPDQDGFKYHFYDAGIYPTQIDIANESERYKAYEIQADIDGKWRNITQIKQFTPDGNEKTAYQISYQTESFAAPEDVNRVQNLQKSIDNIDIVTQIKKYTYGQLQSVKNYGMTGRLNRLVQKDGHYDDDAPPNNTSKPIDADPVLNQDLQSFPDTIDSMLGQSTQGINALIRENIQHEYAVAYYPGLFPDDAFDITGNMGAQQAVTLYCTGPQQITMIKIIRCQAKLLTLSLSIVI